MYIGRHTSWVALVALICSAGCAGNGQGLDQNGQPLSSDDSSSGPITADFQSIQDHVFTPICSKCHIGASAPEGLQLDAEHSYNLLVGVPSEEQPSLLRVKPSDPDDSYIVHKIEGLPGIDGGQMPLGETPLPPATIDAIRQWITNGAPNAPAAAAAATAVFAVQATAPQDKTSVTGSPARIVVSFTQEVDASVVNETTVTLARVDGTAGATNDMALGAPSSARGIAADAALASLNRAVLLITPRAALDPGVYRVTLRGTGGGALANMNSATLGLDDSFEFTVESAR
jgi:methionine-rich copper-binding protein CopC